MTDKLTVDQKFQLQAQENAKNARLYGAIFILTGLVLQILHLLEFPIRGMKAMTIIAGIVLVGSGILFILGSYTVPEKREEFIKRLQKIMLDKNPDRRLWAAQRLVGYVKEANFTNKQILEIAKNCVNVIKSPPVSKPYQPYVAVDHIILLRELAVAVDMDKHTRRNYSQIVRPLLKLDHLGEDAQNILADAVAYHPDKLPIQAYNDLRKQKEELEE